MKCGLVLLVSGFLLISAVLSAEHHNEHHQQHLKEKFHEHHKHLQHNLKEKSHEHHEHLQHQLKEKSHEHNAKHNHYSARHHSHLQQHNNPASRLHHHSSHFSDHSYRDNNKNQICRQVCTDVPNNQSPSTGFGLEVVYDSSSSLFAVDSRSLNLALVFDYSSNVILLINGRSGVTIVVDLRAQQVLRIQRTPQTQDVLWNPSKESLQQYLQKLSVTNLIKIGEQYGQKSPISNIPDIVLKEIGDILKNLGIPLPPNQVLRFFSTYSAFFKNFLPFIYKGSGSFNLPNNFNWFLKLNLIISNLLNPENSGLDLSKINIDPKRLFQGPSGIETIIQLFSQLGGNTDLSKLAQNLFSSRERAINFLSEISSGSNNGLDGLITILVNIVKALNGQGSVGEVISSVLKYNGTSLNEPTYAQVINQALSLSESQLNLFNNSAFEGVYKFLKALVDNNLFLSNVNIGDIIKVFFSPNPIDRFNTVIKILSTLAPQRTIPQFFKFITEWLGSTEGSELLHTFLPGINISQFTGGGNILQNILQGRNLTELLASGQNISSILSQIPIFGQIASQISSHLQQNGKNLGQYFDPSHWQSLLQGGFGNLTSGGGFVNILGHLLNSSQGGDIAANIQNAIQQILNSTEGANGNPFGGLASGIQHGIQQLLNSSQGGNGNPFGGIASAIQNGIHQILNSTQGGNGNPLGGIASGIQNGIHQILNLTQGESGNPLGGIASGIQNGIHQILNSTQGGNPLGGIASSIQNGIGNLFGIGTSQQASVQSSTEDNSSTSVTNGSVSEGNNSSVSEANSPVAETSSEVSSRAVDNNEPQALTRNEPGGWNLNPFGLRGYWAGSMGLNFRNKNKVQHYLHSQKDQEDKEKN